MSGDAGVGLYARTALSLFLVAGVNAVGLAAVLAPAALVLDPLAVGAAGLALLAAVLAVEYRYATRAGVAGATPDPALTDLAGRLAAQTSLSPPEVVVLDTGVPNSFALGGVRSGTVVLTRGLVEALDDRELRAVLAHEIAHLRNRDAVVATLAAAVPLALVRLERSVLALGSAEAGALGGTARREDGDGDRDGHDHEDGGGDGRGDGDGRGNGDPSPVRVWAVLVAAFAVVLGPAVLTVAVGLRRGWPLARTGDLAVVVLAATQVLLVVALVVLSVLVYALPVALGPFVQLLRGLFVLAVAPMARSRELAADRGAARVTGDPAALAAALETLYDAGPGSDTDGPTRAGADDPTGVGANGPTGVGANDPRGADGDRPDRGRGGLDFLTVAPPPLPASAFEDAPGPGTATAAFGDSWVGLLFDPEFHPSLDRRLAALADVTDPRPRS